MAGKVVQMGFEIISLFEGYFLMTVKENLVSEISFFKHYGSIVADWWLIRGDPDPPFPMLSSLGMQHSLSCFCVPIASRHGHMRSH